ncbi:hypothetical protein B0J15DRAFT_463830 [Fusarium solani]|uniref:Protein BIG1 n=1 Tax=Fusarium solani TaxID=169388 RepID=A0A9P9HWH6_FUSSL|nr:uncharacterized protein B0J15DRAFT_463830 [Fusarium solani]KAH7263904.1 hypothetical protein B0J15DRAFT_463830 [Fusarium solani]
MRLQILTSALALAGSATAFSDSWPLVMFSTSEFPDAPSSNQVQTRSQAIEQVNDILSTCPTDNYLLVIHKDVNAADLRRPQTMPYLHLEMESKDIHGKFIVPEVVGESINKKDIEDYVSTACSQQGKDAVFQTVELKSLDNDPERRDNVDLWQQAKSLIEKGSHTVLFVGTPRPSKKSASSAEKTIYESEFVEPVRMDVKRDVTDGFQRRADNETEWDNRPLFQKYQFFTPGIFMALITAIVLFSILGVGLRALASLEVSYGAFDKDMGPAAQKKQQ